MRAFQKLLLIALIPGLLLPAGVGIQFCLCGVVGVGKRALAHVAGKTEIAHKASPCCGTHKSPRPKRINVHGVSSDNGCVCVNLNAPSQPTAVGHVPAFSDAVVPIPLEVSPPPVFANHVGSFGFHVRHEARYRPPPIDRSLPLLI